LQIFNLKGLYSESIFHMILFIEYKLLLLQFYGEFKVNQILFEFIINVQNKETTLISPLFLNNTYPIYF